MSGVDRFNTALSGRYAIEREVGAGGMATVYLARDLRHNRRVALKVLSPELGAVLGTERFLSEIETTANLQHPHLLPLFDSGEADGLLFYVMPYVEGESLRSRLERERQLPVEEAVRIAAAVASALDYAHRHDVIHRDLKPENILLHEGQPLVADFGIALAVSKAGGARITQTGLSLGTPQYMSPEQATGDRVIDARSDIYSLGAVLYEMLVGDPPHMAGTTQAVIAKVLTEKPTSVRVYRDMVPEHVDTAVQRALAKLPADRFGSAGEFADALTGARVVTVPPTTAPLPVADDAFVFRIPARVKRRVKAALPWATAAAAVLVATVFALRRPAVEGVSGWPTVFPITFADSVEVLTPGAVTIAISRDGSQIAFDGAAAGVAGIFVRRLDAFDARFVRGTENGTRPVFSPNGDWLLFSGADGRLRKVPVGGGAPLALTDSAVIGNASWGNRNEVVYGYGGRLFLVSAEGGPRTLLATADSARAHMRYGWPHVLPGGEVALITIWKGGIDLANAELGLIRLRDGAVTELGVPGTGPRYLSTGHIVFGRADGSIFAAPFSPRRLRLTGPPVPVLEDVIVKGGGAVEIGISDNGTLLYKGSGSSPYRQLVRVSRQGAEAPLGVDSQAVRYPRVSPDGRRIALSIEAPSTEDVWVKDLVTRALTRITSGGNSSQRPEWTPDGRRIAYVYNESGVTRPLIRVQPWDGSGTAEVFAAADLILGEISFGPVGGYFALRTSRAVGGARDIHIAPYDSPHALRPFLATPVMETLPRVSPDGRLLAYVTDETGRREVYVRPLPGPGGRVQVSIEGGDEPVWAPGGDVLYYRGPTHFTAAMITQRPELDVVRRDPLFPDPYMRESNRANYDVFPNGTDFVFVRNIVPERPRLTGVAHWTTELLRRAPAASPAR